MAFLGLTAIFLGSEATLKDAQEARRCLNEGK